jgi:hypothetical protein
MQCAAGTWIDWLVVERIQISAFMRSAEGRSEIFAGAAAGIDESAIEEFLPRSAVDLGSLALRIGGARTADVRAFLPT